MDSLERWLIFGLVFIVAAAAYVLWRKRRRGREVVTPFAGTPVRMLPVGDWEIRYHMSGRGPYLLMIHGIGANLFSWRYLFPYLSSHFTVIALDLPGFGQSSKLDGAFYGLDEQAARVRDFLLKLGVNKTNLLGSSMGGNIAMWFALKYPAMSLSTTVIGPASSPALVPLSMKNLAFLSRPLAALMSRRAMRWAQRRTVSRKDLIGQDRIEEAFNTYGNKHKAVRSFILATEAIRDPRLPRAFADLKTKVLILWGSKDLLVSRRVIDELEAQLVDHESYVHLGGGHHLQEDEPEWVAEKVLTLL